MPSKADPCVRMRENKDLKCYEHIPTHDDDLCLVAQCPGKIIQILKEDYKLKVKRDGPLNHHFGDYSRDQSMFKQDPPKNMRILMNKNDHPELDGIELLTGKSTTMIGQLQWLVALGRFDIHTQVTTLSRFRSAPRKRHLERLQRIYGYVKKI